LGDWSTVEAVNHVVSVDELIVISYTVCTNYTAQAS